MLVYINVNEDHYVVLPSIDIQVRLGQTITQDDYYTRFILGGYPKYTVNGVEIINNIIELSTASYSTAFSGSDFKLSTTTVTNTRSFQNKIYLTKDLKS